MLATWRDHPGRPARWPRWRRRWPGGTPYGWSSSGLPRGVGGPGRGEPRRAPRSPRTRPATLCERTDGNPFFLVEFARLAGERTDLDTLLAADDPPTAVRSAGAAAGPAARRDGGRAADGRGHRAPLRIPDPGARGPGIDEDDLLDVVEPAQAAGLVREDGVDRWWFAHALVRDTLRAGPPPAVGPAPTRGSPRRWTASPGRETEVARHWLGAGPAYADRAWRAALAAAEVARRLHAHDEAGELLTRALEALREDPAATARDRYDLLLRSSRRSGGRPSCRRSCRRSRTPSTSARAGGPRGGGPGRDRDQPGVSLALRGPPGEVNDKVVGALRGSLERLPTEDSELRCRTMLALANELLQRGLLRGAAGPGRGGAGHGPAGSATPPCG